MIANLTENGLGFFVSKIKIMAEWKFTRSESGYGVEFYIESNTRKIRIPSFRYDGLHPTILTLTQSEFESFRNFYFNHQDTVRSCGMYEHSWFNVGGMADRVEQHLSPTTIQLLDDAGILEPSHKPEHFQDVLANRNYEPVISKKEKHSGYVYLMTDLNLDNAIKVGFSKVPKIRESTLQAEKPTIKLINAWKGSQKDETELHNHFQDKRIRGEWFDLNESDIQYIDNKFADREQWSK